ncbi:MAG: GDSL-type esterase/lipase family protein [Gammaproteobacteria bacterium]|nr:GDSL-type esterase/lipase family protein [Gammaproteobacteria bacterium]
MHSLPIKDLIAAAAVDHGALDFDDRGTGLAPRRLPDWTRAQLPQPMDVTVRMPSGVRLRFATESTGVGISFLATTWAMPDRERRPVVFNLETDGTLLRAESMSGNAILVKPEAPGGFDLVRGEADTLLFDDLPSGDKTCELWLPHNSLVELRALVVDDGAAITAAPADGRRRWVHYGSSISHCMEASEPAGTWPAVAARLADVSLRNLGFGGQCHLDQFVARTIRDLPEVDIVSIKTGINIVNLDSMRERVFTPALHGFLDTIREAKPEVPIVVISPIYCPSAETRPGPTIPDGQGKFVTIDGFEQFRNGSLSLVRIREIIADVVEKRRTAGDPALHYVDGLTLFGAEDAHDLPDDLHPNPAGYRRMGERFAPRLAEIAATLD